MNTPASILRATGSGPSPLPPSRSYEHPESSPPVGVQATTLSFEDALRCFAAQHSRRAHPRDGQIEAAMLIDMNNEKRAPRPALRKPCVTRHSLQFAAWVATKRQAPTVAAIMARFDVQRATAYRWLALWSEIRDSAQ